MIWKACQCFSSTSLLPLFISSQPKIPHVLNGWKTSLLHVAPLFPWCPFLLISPLVFFPFFVVYFSYIFSFLHLKTSLSSSKICRLTWCVCMCGPWQALLGHESFTLTSQHKSRLWQTHTAPGGVFHFSDSQHVNSLKKRQIKNERARTIKYQKRKTGMGRDSEKWNTKCWGERDRTRNGVGWGKERGREESWTAEKGVSLSHWPGFSEVTLQTHREWRIHRSRESHFTEWVRSACRVLNNAKHLNACSYKG